MRIILPGLATGRAPTPNNAYWPREESRPAKPKTLGGLLSKKGENIVISPIVCASGSKGWSPGRILSYLRAKRRRDGTVGAIRLGCSIQAGLRRVGSPPVW